MGGAGEFDDPDDEDEAGACDEDFGACAGDGFGHDEEAFAVAWEEEGVHAHDEGVIVDGDESDGEGGEGIDLDEENDEDEFGEGGEHFGDGAGDEGVPAEAGAEVFDGLDEGFAGALEDEEAGEELEDGESDGDWGDGVVGGAGAAMADFHGDPDEEADGHEDLPDFGASRGGGLGGEVSHGKGRVEDERWKNRRGLSRMTGSIPFALNGLDSVWRRQIIVNRVRR